jgi:hypothetical protein
MCLNEKSNIAWALMLIINIQDGLLQPSPSEVRIARFRSGLSMAQAAQLVGGRESGEHAGNTWRRYEKGERHMALPVWALFLLLTRQHPSWALLGHPAWWRLMPDPTPQLIRQHRQIGPILLTLEDCTRLIQVCNASKVTTRNWERYEQTSNAAQQRNMPLNLWGIFLLSTGSHPHLKLIAKQLSPGSITND